ncbi:DUF6518 family protein [Paenibacillus monticola]|uniref:Uncharacterized protein n=1 Tax=Paenibacillus monticola TaxID=2666075 RepID=A0A7X2L0F0_9BACL|nr:DUF6518 family protein [Paenibacillus monticola]MRN52657.1 hypothetical protein [Paenibacillus monticola]
MIHSVAQRQTMKLWKSIFFSVVIGIVVGILTVLGQGILPGNWNSLANSGTVWLIPTFFIGALGSRKLTAAINGILSLFGMVAGYYAYAMLIQDVSHSLYYILLWTGAAVVGGIIFGIAGHLWRQGRSWWRHCGSALLGGVFITEGLNLFIHIDDYRHMLAVGVVEIIVGLGLVLVLERTNRARGYALLLLLPVIILGLIGYQVLRSFAG